MYLEKLTLINYKNFKNFETEFDSEINCVIGANGTGKSTVLDAVYHLCFTKGYFNHLSTQNISHGEDFFVVEGGFNKNEKDITVHISFKKNHKKVVKQNGKVYTKISEHIGQLPLVIISPMDIDLIVEGSDTRRKFLDGMIAQNDRMYLEHLLQYNAALNQRNALLKYFSANNTFQQDTLEVYNRQLIEFGEQLHRKRMKFVTDFETQFIQQYEHLSQSNEVVSLRYKSDLIENEFEVLLRDSLAKDRMAQYTTKGIHKDDLQFNLSGHPIKRFGSQGQQKTFLIALKLAQYKLLNQRNNIKPILLLDDIFDKLDHRRVTHLVQLVKEKTFGQVFISDTDLKRTKEVVEQTNQSFKIIEF